VYGDPAAGDRNLDESTSSFSLRAPGSLGSVRGTARSFVQLAGGETVARLAGPVAVLAWFTEMVADKIGRITPDGTLAEFSIAARDTSSASKHVSAHP
jgi:hypothetical protein